MLALGAPAVEAYLNHLAVVRHASTLTQSQAPNTLPLVAARYMLPKRYKRAFSTFPLLMSLGCKRRLVPSCNPGFIEIIRNVVVNDIGGETTH